MLLNSECYSEEAQNSPMVLVPLHTHGGLASPDRWDVSAAHEDDEVIFDCAWLECSSLNTQGLEIRPKDTKDTSRSSKRKHKPDHFGGLCPCLLTGSHGLLLFPALCGLREKTVGRWA